MKTKSRVHGHPTATKSKPVKLKSMTVAEFGATAEVTASMKKALAGPKDPARQRRLHVVDVATPPSAADLFRDGPLVHKRDYQGRSALEVARVTHTGSTGTTFIAVRFIPMDGGSALKVQEQLASQFDERYSRVVELPMLETAKSFAHHAKSHGASKEVLAYLAKYKVITDDDVNEAAAKQEAAMAQFKERIAMAKLVKQQAKSAKKSTKPQGAWPAKTPGEPRETASAMFKALIMEGKLTDDAIFAKVKAKFGLDDKKRGYVGWYRNDLKKKGQKPPPPVTK